MSRVGAKAKRGERTARALPVLGGRACGECSECCTVLAVHEIGKAPRERCAHQCEAGCATYATRPAICAGFGCGWLAGFGGEAMRPDRSGVLLHAQRAEHYPGVSEVRATETRRGAIGAIDTGALMEAINAYVLAARAWPATAHLHPVATFEVINDDGSLEAFTAAASEQALAIMAKVEAARVGIGVEEARRQLLQEIPNTLVFQEGDAAASRPRPSPHGVDV